MSEENLQLKRILEGAILASHEPLSLNKLQALFEEEQAPDKSVLTEVLKELEEEFSERGFELKEVGSGWRFQVKANLAPWVNRLWEEKPQKYSRALLETLALIAYRQPLTRGDIEEVRGVAVSSHIIKTLTERDWVKVVGHRDVPGRPALYATTRVFLDYFNLKNLDELPTLGELKDIDSLNKGFEFDETDDKESGESDSESTSDSAPANDAEILAFPVAAKKEDDLEEYDELQEDDSEEQGSHDEEAIEHADIEAVKKQTDDEENVFDSTEDENKPHE